MTKLENIPKKTVFTVPDGYFEKLPARIQSRIPTEAVNTGFSTFFRYHLRYALLLVLVAAAVFYYYTPSRPDPEAILAKVETSDLILYIEETSVPASEELLEGMDVSTADLEAIENEVYDLGLEGAGKELLELELNDL